MSDKVTDQFQIRQYPDTLNPLDEDCPPWTRHAQYLKEQEDIWEHAAVLSECDCNDCHLDRLCPYKFKHDEESQKGCVKRLHDDLLRPIADGMSDHDKILVTMKDMDEKLHRMLAIDMWLWTNAKEAWRTSDEGLLLCQEIGLLKSLEQTLWRRIFHAKQDECRYDGTNFTGLE